MEAMQNIQNYIMKTDYNQPVTTRLQKQAHRPAKTCSKYRIGHEWDLKS